MIQSINRAMQIIETLSQNEKEQWLASELAEETGLPISTVYRITQSLIQHGLVTQIEATKHYELGYKWMELGLKMFEKLDVRDVTRPVLERLALEVEETVYLNLPRGFHSIIIERIDSPRNVKILDSIGERIPLHIGGANKSILANMPHKEVEEILERLVPVKLEREEFKKELASVKQKGYGISYGEKTKGTIAIGSPVFDFDGRVVGAISIEVLAYDITDERMRFFIEKVYEAAQQISSELSGAQLG
ncbi:IclR family transcriptional regulator [Filibacter tadaridae]|uniref:HTH-type transcriptional regulator KipR n=1 Tax=Filibacter tadaridae TaxID=2483811 RepID=A0A3P5XD99_9BACL|nr:IclR family transcriptional regulator [Filibacter tadaridae]VDC28203.1 HTH-type transcriptional regulator KipR [Filibacter tadaridae]